MKNNKTLNSNLFLSLLHLAMGVLLISAIVTKIFSVLIVAFGILFIIRSKNENNEAIFWAAYMIGAEVLFRMSGGMFFHELPKYSVLLFLLTGLLVEQRKHHISVSYLIYILLLLIGIAFVNIPFGESIRKAIAFNLSGPILLGVSAIYFYKRPIPIHTLLKMLFFMALPIISMLSLLYFKTPDIKSIVFGSVSNFEASGGYGPNQVSTLLGVGVFIVAAHLFFKQRFFLFFTLDLLLLAYLIFRGLITLSRGGMISAFVATIIFAIFYVLSKQDKIKSILKYIGLLMAFGVALWFYSSDATGGMLANRYANKSSVGLKKKDASAGRIDLFKSEIDAFLENPFFGIGVGGGKYYRLDKLDKVTASHNEISRLIGEHGLIGIIALLLLIFVPIRHMFQQSYLARAFLSAFFVFWFLTINHSAMRIAFPAFIYGLSMALITFNEKNTVHRK